MAGQAWEFIHLRMETNLQFVTRANCVRVCGTSRHVAILGCQFFVSQFEKEVIYGLQ